MKNRLNICWVIGFCMLLSGCYKDEGNYDYITLPSIQITAEDIVYATQFETLSLPMAIDWDNASEEEYEFSWRIWSNEIGGVDKQKVISNTKDLSYVVNELPGSYTLLFACKNKETGVETYKEMKLSVQGIITEGWLVLHENNGKSDFDLIMTPYFSDRVEEDKILHNLYESVNGEPLVGRGVMIRSYFALGRYQYVTVMTENGGARLSAQTMQKTFDLSDLMLDKKPLKPENYFFFHYRYQTCGPGYEAMISDGRFYLNSTLGSGYTEPIFTDGTVYKAAPYTAQWMWTFAAIIYDELGGRFIGVDKDQKTHDLPSAAGRTFDWNDMKGTMRYMNLGFAHSGWASFWDYALIEDWNTRELTLYALSFDEKSDFDRGMWKAKNCSEFSDAKFYAIGTRGPVFYYATDRNVYQWDYNGTGESTMVWSSPSANERITGMKLLNPYVDRFVQSHSYDNKVLIFSTYNENTKEGKIYMYYVNVSNGAIDLSSEKVFGGFGEILDMDYNYPKYGS